MLWNREEYLSHMTFQGSPGEFFCELFGPLVGLEEEWRAQGATDAECDLSAFGWDGVRVEDAGCATGAISGITPRVLQEDDREIHSIDTLGRHVKLCKGSATIPLPQDYPVRGPEDWERIKPWFAFREERVDTERLKKLRDAQREGTLITAWMPGGFDAPRELMGEAALCLAYYDNPDMLQDMLNTMADTCLKVFERVCEYVTVDVLCVHEDMAGKSGPLIGQKQVKAFITPYYKKIWEPLKAHGSTLFSQDSDGNMDALIDAFLEAGVNVMYPLEPQAGMDMVTVRQKYGSQVAFKGGIDKFALRGTKEDIRRELEYKMSAAMKGGGVNFALDHRIPNGVPIENYRYYVALGRELLGKGPAVPAPHIRMAF
ncbi:MAG: uroporphyrinogen decarboxylase family protein [Eubacteriales bacterium]|nr:uroporphyrinogen decarboxylase family protein [Eubacteriales bacterium]